MERFQNFKELLSSHVEHNGVEEVVMKFNCTRELYQINTVKLVIMTGPIFGILAISFLASISEAYTVLTDSADTFTGNKLTSVHILKKLSVTYLG